MKDRDSCKQDADHHAKRLTSTAWLMTILQAKNTTVGIVATCSRRGSDPKPSITAEIAYYTHGSLITQNCQWKYLLRPPLRKSLLRTTTNCYYRKPPDPVGSALDSFQHVKADFDEGHLLTVDIRLDRGPILFVSNVYNHVAAEGNEKEPGGGRW